MIWSLGCTSEHRSYCWVAQKEGGIIEQRVVLLSKCVVFLNKGRSLSYKGGCIIEQSVVLSSKGVVLLNKGWSSHRAKGGRIVEQGEVVLSRKGGVVKGGCILVQTVV
jgi:hypothetical protein